MNFHRCLLSLALVAACLTSSPAQGIGDKSHVVAQIMADTQAVVPGKPFTVGIFMELDPGWHTYWRFPGDSGGAPRVEWQLPTGFTAGEIQWPVPRAHMDAGDMLTYVYEDEVMLLVEITPPPQIQDKEVKLAAQLRWLVCEKTCIPGEGHIGLTLPVGGDASPANPDAFQKWRQQLPKTTAPPFSATWDVTKRDAVGLAVSGINADSEVEFYPLPPEGASVEHPKIDPTPDGTRVVTLAYSAEQPLTQPWSGVVAIRSPNGSRDAWTLTAPSAANTASQPSLKAAAPSTAEKVQVAPAPEKRNLLTMLGIAFLGGLLLNVMPCVLPVIALKIFGFVRQAQESRERVFRLGLSFVAGVFVFFIGVAAIAVVLGRSFNWGYQFQNPFILTGLIALVFVFGLNMLGVFEVTLSSEAASKLSELSGKEGYTGAFLHGLFTTLLGTSCTAPLLAPSLGYAATQPPAMVFFLFLAIATGMSLPYFLLTANPSWLKFVPKPGMWMERVKQLLGFVVLSVAIWLLTVLTGTHGTDAGAAVTWYLLALAVACWAVGAFAQKRGISLVIGVVAVAGWFSFVQGALRKSESTPVAETSLAESGGIAWQPWSEQGLTQALQAGTPVFVDFTAKWCINCKFFERTVLETDSIRAAFRDKGIVALKADWTKPDPAIASALRSFGRVGVPLYVLYRPGEAQPVVMDGLTQGGLLEQIAAISKPATGVAASTR